MSRKSPRRRPSPRCLPPSRPARVAAVACLALLVWGAPGPVPGSPLAAQAAERGEEGADAPRLFPDRTSFAPLLAAPREVTLRGGFVVADRDLDRHATVDPGGAPSGAFGDFEGANIEAEVALGHRIGVLRLRPAGGDGPEVTLGFEVGVFTRFFMESPQKDLINADFRVGAPVSARYAGWEGRLTLLHVSSHFGDDFVNRFDPPPSQTTRDGFELLVGRRLDRWLPGLRLYAGGEWNFHVNRGVERTAARGGLEWDPDPGRTESGSVRDRGAALVTWPYAGVDFRITSNNDEVAGTGIGGMALRVRDVTLRLEARGHLGPSPMGKLRHRDEQFLGVNLRVEI